MNRRNLIKSVSAGAVGLAATELPAIVAAEAKEKHRIRHRQIRQSVIGWCFFFTLISVASALPPYALEDYNQRFIKGSLTPIRELAQIFYVSGKIGDDANPGSKEAPVKTLKAAQDLVRQLRKEKGLLPGGIKVLIGADHYHLSSPLIFDERDTGTFESPVVWQGIDKNKVTISGGTILDAAKLELIQHKEGLQRLHPKARGHVMGMDLQTANVSSFQDGRGNYGLLSMNGHLLQQAQWPNIGYHHIGRIVDRGPSTRKLKPGESPPPYSIEKPSGGRFIFSETLPKAIGSEFANSGDMQVQGYLHNDWYFQSEAVGCIDGDVVQLLHHTRYGIEDGIKRLPRRVKLVNLLSELDQPGEWYYDYKKRGLYVWPIKGFKKEVGSLVLPGGKTLISLKKTNHFTLRGVTIENTGDLAVDVRGGHHNLIADCIIRNGKKRCINITGGTHNGITGCLIHNLQTAFSISGGNAKTLERCYHFATNNEIHSCRRRGYGMISLYGVGIRFAHNLLYDMNGSVYFSTVDLLMEYNEFYNIGYEMGDFNLAYCGAQWWSMGNVISFNFVHHIIEPGGHPVSPFRNDDGGAGLNIFGNVFYRTGRCAAQFAGPANTIENNIALDMGLFWWTNKRPISPEGIKNSWAKLARFGRDLKKGDKGDFLYIAEKKLGEKFWTKQPWKSEYPEVGKFIKINPWAQTLGKVDRNYTYNVRKPIYIHGGDGTIKGMESKENGTFKDLPREGVFRFPEPIQLNQFEDPKKLNFKLKSSFRRMDDFVDIPFEKIGLTKDYFRKSFPDKDLYRTKQYEKFKNDRRQRYNAAIVNARYPVPSYLR